jgi:hypothetical protein
MKRNEVLVDRRLYVLRFVPREKVRSKIGCGKEERGVVGKKLKAAGYNIINVLDYFAAQGTRKA